MSLYIYIHTHTHTHGKRKQLEVMDMLITLIVMIVTRVYACVQNHQIACIKYVHFLVYQLDLNKKNFFYSNDPLPKFWWYTGKFINLK